MHGYSWPFNLCRVETGGGERACEQATVYGDAEAGVRAKLYTWYLSISAARGPGCGGEGASILHGAETRPSGERDRAWRYRNGRTERRSRRPNSRARAPAPLEAIHQVKGSRLIGRPPRKRLEAGLRVTCPESASYESISGERSGIAGSVHTQWGAMQSPPMGRTLA